MTSTGNQTLMLVVKNVLRKPVTFAIGVLSVAGALIAGDLWPIAAGAVVEAGIIAYYFRNESTLRRALREERERIRERETEELEDEINQLDPESRFRLRTILALYKEIVDLSDDAEIPVYTQEQLSANITQLGMLVDKAVRLGQKKKELQRYVDRNDEGAISRHIESLQEKIAAADDPVTRGQYQQALNSKQKELETSASIKQALARIDGQLESVECSFASLKATIIRLKTAEINQAAAGWQQMGDELNTLTTDVDTLEKSVNEALTI